MRYLTLVIVVVFTISPVWAEVIAMKHKKIINTPTVSQSEIENNYKEITWDVLIPKDWDPAKPFRKLNLGLLKDSDPQAIEVLEMMKEEWDSAPIDPAMDGAKIKISGFVVPIEENNRAVTEFLLVPYFGACIHVPPPPANQIIHVVSKTPIKNLRVMDSVSVVGQLKAAYFSKKTDMGIGASGYQLNSVSVATYTEPVVSMQPYNPR